jgi:hypothetical protein
VPKRNKTGGALASAVSKKAGFGEEVSFVKGHGFSRAAKGAKPNGALAPEAKLLQGSKQAGVTQW